MPDIPDQNQRDADAVKRDKIAEHIHAANHLVAELNAVLAGLGGFEILTNIEVSHDVRGRITLNFYKIYR